MHAERDLTRVVRSWLQEDEHESADIVLEDVLALLDSTPQHRPWWPVRRLHQMNSIAKFAIAAAAVIVVALIGINLLPRTGGTNVGGPGATASPSPTVSPSRIPSPAPSRAIAFPSAGSLAVGRHTFTEDGVVFSLELANTKWSSSGINCSEGCTKDAGWITTGSGQTATDAWMPIWAVDGVFTDPCKQTAAPEAKTVDALATAVTQIPGTTATAPVDVTVDGHAAKYVEVTIPHTLPCAPNSFHLWYDTDGCGLGPCGRYASAVDSIVRVWVVDVDGKPFWLEGETYKGASPALGQEIKAIVDSVQFE